MKIAIVGTGTVGSILGACLIDKGEDEVCLVDASPERIEQLKKNGISIHDPNKVIKGDFKVKASDVRKSLSALGSEAPELVFVALKTCAIDAVMPELKDLRAAGSTIVSYQNGLDTEGVIGDGIGDRKGVLRIVINYAGKLLEDGRVAVAFFHKPNYVGVLDPAAKPAAQMTAAMMSAAGLETKFTDQIGRQVWEKVILNSAMSPLSALTRLTMAEVMARPELVGVVEGLIREGIEVAKSRGVDFENGFFDHCMGYLKKAGPHKPSMLVDVEAGRCTEIDFLNGMIRKQGAGKVEVPYHATITALIKGVEQNILTRRVNAAAKDAQRQRPAGTLEERKS